MKKFFIALALSLTLFCGTVLGGEVALKWTRNTDTTTTGYEIRYGKTYGDYPNIIDVGNTDHFTVSGLEPGNVYYFTVNAYSVNDVKSGYQYALAEEVTMQVPQGLKLQ